MKKKFLALVLTLAMVLSLAPVGALATDGEEGQKPADVIYDKTAYNGNATVEGVDSLDKTAKKTGENTYEVKLEVKMYETTSTISQAAATVLVIDISNSMNDYMCGKNFHIHTDACGGRRLDAAKTAAENFVNTYAGTQEGTGRNLSIVLFNYNPSVKLDWTDVSTSAGKNKALQTIQNIRLGKYEDGGTNLKGGLSTAGEKLRDTAVADLARNNKNVIVLTDGAPTQPTWNGGSAGSAELNEETANEATNLKEQANIYTICFGAKNEKTYDGWKAPTVGKFLRDSIASSAPNKTYAYNADNASDLNEAFKAISETITSGLSAGTVHDALPEGVTSDAFGGKTTADWDLSTFETKTSNEGDTTHYTYTKTYTVTIDPDEIDSTVPEENNGYYPLNEPTTLTVKVKEGDKEENKVLNFPIPWAYVKRTDMSYTVNYLEKGTDKVLHDAKVVESKTLGDTITAANEKINIAGYNYDSASPETLTIGTGENVINLYYVKRTDMSYTVNYLEKGTDKVLHDAKVVESKTLGDTITAANEKINIAGYNYDSASPETLTIGTGENVINLYYVKRTNLSYTVNYLEKGTNEVVKSAKTADNQTFGATISAADEVIAIDGYTYDSADKTTLTIGTGENVINLYYVKRTDLSYTVNYLEKGTNEVVKSAKTADNQTFGATISAADEVIAIDGYTYDSADPATLTIGTSSNVINLYYTKATVYKITICYINDTGTSIKEAKTIPNKHEGDPYDVESEDYIPARIGDYIKESVPSNVKGTMGKSDVTITVVYTKDVLVDSTVIPKPDGPGDNIPDKYQVIVKYVPDTTGRGTVGQLTEEVLTIYKDNEKKEWASTGTVTATGSTATANGGRNYFSNWTNDAKVDTSKEPATLGKQTFTAEGGKTYTFTANFGRSSGSGSGGSNRPKPPVVEIPDDVPTGLNGKDHYAYVVGYPDGMVYPQKNITRAEVATIFFRLLKDETREANMTKSNSYNDMKDGAWYTCAVSTLSKMGIIKGYEDGSFKPDASISRAEFAAIAARFDPDGDKTPATFSDVSSHWAKDEISIAANHGWIKGYEDGSFKPDQKITRAETMTLVNRVLKRLPETKDDLHKDMKTWPDNQNESAWFYLAVQEATNSHYQKLKKDGTHETWESMRETRDWAALEK